MDNNIKIVLIEDDHFQIEWLREELQRELNAEVNVLTDEADFVSSIGRLAENPPDVFVVDIMMPWNNTDNLEANRELTAVPPGRSDERRAGIRIRDDLKSNPILGSATVILYSVLDATDLPQGTHYVPKESSIEPLASAIRLALRRGATITRR